MKPILVTGGTGTLGRHVTHRLRDAGHDVRVLTRRRMQDEAGIRFVTGDLVSGAGVQAAVNGVGTILHCAGSNKGDEVATANLVTAAAQVGRAHIIYISVVGADRIPVAGLMDRLMFGYFAMKRTAEQVVANSGLPWTTIRATQFHDLLLFVLKTLTTLPVVPYPSRMYLQPIEADAVAKRLVEVGLGSPAGLVGDVGGPRVYRTADLVRGYLNATHRRRLLLPLRLPGRAARALRSGANLAPEHALASSRTWEEYLANSARTSAGSDASNSDHVALQTQGAQLSTGRQRASSRPADVPSAPNL